jgi:hypothetical protein
MKTRAFLIGIVVAMAAFSTPVLASVAQDPYEDTKAIIKKLAEISKQQKTDEKKDSLSWVNDVVDDIQGFSDLIGAGTDLYNTILAIFGGGSASSIYDNILTANKKGDFFQESYNNVFNKQPTTTTLPDGTTVIQAAGGGDQPVAAAIIGESTKIDKNAAYTTMSTKSSESIAKKYSEDTKPTELYDWVMGDSGTAVQLENGMQTAVSTRAAVQALGEGFANYMRQAARGDAAVITRLNGILMQSVETNKQLQVLADQQFEQQRAKVNQIKAEYGALKAQGKNDVKSIEDVTKNTSKFIALGTMKFEP